MHLLNPYHSLLVNLIPNVTYLHHYYEPVHPSWTQNVDPSDLINEMVVIGVVFFKDLHSICLFRGGVWRGGNVAKNKYVLVPILFCFSVLFLYIACLCMSVCV